MWLGKNITLFLSTGNDAMHVFRKKNRHTNLYKVKLKFSHNLYQALGPELIPLYRQSDRR